MSLSGWTIEGRTSGPSSRHCGAPSRPPIRPAASFGVCTQGLQTRTSGALRPSNATRMSPFRNPARLATACSPYSPRCRTSQGHAIARQIRRLSFFVGQIVEPHPAEPHSPQVPGRRPPRDVAVPPPLWEFERRVPGLAAPATSRAGSVRGSRSIVQDPLQVGDREQWLPRQCHDIVAGAQTGPLGDGAGRDPLDLGHLLRVQLQTQHAGSGYGKSTSSGIDSPAARYTNRSASRIWWQCMQLFATCPS